MRDDLKYPSAEAIQSVLRKINCDLSDRDLSCQDAEYTICRLEELPKYVDLYVKNDTTAYEKRVLGCFILETLSEHIQTFGSPHPLQNQAFQLLHADHEIHTSELAYWSDISDPDRENWWPITEQILSWRDT